MQPSANRSRPLLPKPANIGQGTLRNDNPLVQSNDGVLTFSLTVTPEHVLDLRHPTSTNHARTTASSTNSRGNDFERVCDTRRAIGSLRCRFCESVWPSKRSLLVHLQKHSRDASRETDALLEKLVSSLSALGKDRRTACHEGTISDGSSAKQWEPEVETDSTPENAWSLPFSLKPVLDLDALEQVVEQEEDAVPVSCDLDVAEEESPDGLGNENANEPSSAQCLPDPSSGGNVVINESPDPASGGDHIKNEKSRTPFERPHSQR
ncbi:hypothetical protein MTO96_016499 [Rhipicephalus appendiculatus]